MKKKAYMAPAITITTVEMQAPLASSNSVTSVSGIDGLTVGDGDFSGGAADSRRGGSLWDDED